MAKACGKNSIFTQKPHELKVVMILKEAIVSESDTDNMHNSAGHELSAIPTPGSFILVKFSTRVFLGQVKSTEGNDFEVTFLRAKDDEHKIFSFPQGLSQDFHNRVSKMGFQEDRVSKPPH